MSGQFLIGGIGDIVALGPIAHRRQIDIDETGGKILPVAEQHRLFDIGEKFVFVLDIFGRKQRAALELALGADGKGGAAARVGLRDGGVLHVDAAHRHRLEVPEAVGAQHQRGVVAGR